LEAREHELRQRLAAVLPHYMVPDEFVFLQELPRTPSQKLDRRALPKPGRKTRSAAVAFAAPASELEKSVATIFSEVLNVSAVGREDNFFDLGGHSLHVVSVVAKVRDRHDYAMEIVELFQFPTVRALAARILASDAPDPVLDAQDRSRLRQSQMQHRARARQSRRTGAENDGRADRGR
jgi:acyl carrier protein